MQVRAHFAQIGASMCMWGVDRGEGEREGLKRDGDSETEKERGKTDRWEQTDRQADRQTQTYIYSEQPNRQTDRDRQVQTGRHRHSETQTYRQGQTERHRHLETQTCRQIGRQRQTNADRNTQTFRDTDRWQA